MKVQVELVPDGVDEDGQPIFSTIEDSFANQAEAYMRDCIAKKVDALIKDKVNDEVIASIREQAREKVLEVLDKPIVPTSKYGEQKGEPITILELVAEHVKHAIEKPQGSSASYGEERMTIIQSVCRKAASEMVTAEVKKQVDEIKVEIQRQVCEKIAGLSIKKA